MFKYIVVVNGSKNNLIRFATDTEKLGYKGVVDKVDKCLDGYALTFNYSLSNKFDAVSGRIDFFSNESDYWKKKGFYAFEIDNQNEYNTALGIAAITTDDKYHVGEWSIFNDKNITGGKDEMRLVIPDNVNWLSGNKCFLGAANGLSGYKRKATPEEIINFYKVKTNIMSDKKIIGYKAPFDMFGGEIKKGTLYGTEDGKDRSGYFIPIEIVSTWEPVYEQVREVIIVGSRNQAVTIGQNEILFRDRKSTISEVLTLLNKFKSRERESSTIGDYEVYLDKNVRFIRIGCTEENNLFSIGELVNVVNTYNKVNNIPDRV